MTLANKHISLKKENSVLLHQFLIPLYT